MTRYQLQVIFPDGGSRILPEVYSSLSTVKAAQEVTEEQYPESSLHIIRL